MVGVTGFEPATYTSRTIIPILAGLFACILQHFPHLRAYSFANTFQCLKGYVLLAALDCAVVGAMHVDLVCEAFLAVSGRLASLANSCADALKTRSSPHGDSTLSGFLFWLYSAIRGLVITAIAVWRRAAMTRDKIGTEAAPDGESPLPDA